MIKKISILHTHGYLHNDLKTSNIMLFKGQPFIIDFGMADKYSKSL
jgi:tRNA A-37 threonylcarbamoyl transferase component Bud32